MVAFFVVEYWPWVGGICKCLGANAWEFPGVNPPGWPLISALLSRFLSDRVAMFTQAMGMTASDWSASDVVKTRQNNHLNLASLIFHKNCCLVY